MSKKIFVDSDIILDLLCKREPFYAYSAELFTLGDMEEVELYTTSLVFANVFYILRKIRGNEKAKELLRKLRILLRIIPVGENSVDLALNSSFNDFEDGLQYFTAREQGFKVLLTRNTKDYRVKDVLIQTAEEYIKMRRNSR
ncbi:MAG: PIN domain-containing protein [Spirochaetaceae bacterium]|jgi:predicted nucleic acid-binding protein|nr:PIN domain-containing protein [Spirochaetaceae bacterium]